MPKNNPVHKKNLLRNAISTSILAFSLSSFSPAVLQGQFKDPPKQVTQRTTGEQVTDLIGKGKSWLKSKLESLDEKTKSLEAMISSDQGVFTNVTDFQAIYRTWKNMGISFLTGPLPTQEGSYDNALHIMLGEQIKGSWYNVTKLDIPFYRINQISFDNYPVKTMVADDEFKKGSMRIKLKNGSSHVIQWIPKHNGLLNATYFVYYKELAPNGSIVKARGPENLDGFTCWKDLTQNSVKQLDSFVGKIHLKSGQDKVFSISVDDVSRITFK